MLVSQPRRKGESRVVDVDPRRNMGDPMEFGFIAVCRHCNIRANLIDIKRVSEGRERG